MLKIIEKDKLKRTDARETGEIRQQISLELNHSTQRKWNTGNNYAIYYR
jgi:hypothetical protein